MKISAIMIGEYLEYVTVLWFGGQRLLPPADINDYLPFIHIMHQHAVINGELEHLKLAFEYLLNSLEVDCEQFDGSNYPYNNEEIRAIIALAYNTIWLNAPLPPKRHDIEIVGEYLAEWRHDALC